MACIWCGTTPVTQEHVWPDWLRDVLPGDGPGHYVLARDASEFASPRTWSQPAFNATVGVVCADCNNGWMSETETRARDNVAAMATGMGVVELDIQAQVEISTWCVLRAFMNHFTGSLTYVPEAHLQQVFATGMPPTQAVVWLAAYSEPKEIASYRGIGGTPSEPGPLPKGANVYTATLSIGNMAFRVFGHQMEGTFRFATEGTFEGALLQIWPPMLGVAKWPPPVALDSDGMAALRDALLADAYREGSV
jgi:hypothetical protein